MNTQRANYHMKLQFRIDLSGYCSSATCRPTRPTQRWHRFSKDKYLLVISSDSHQVQGVLWDRVMKSLNGKRTGFSAPPPPKKKTGFSGSGFSQIEMNCNCNVAPGVFRKRLVWNTSGWQHNVSFELWGCCSFALNLSERKSFVKLRNTVRVEAYWA